jgi:hypothetical protein
MGETWRGLMTDFGGTMLSLSMPTHTQDFVNHSNGYGRLKTALMWSVSGSPKIGFVEWIDVGNSFGSSEDYDF